MFAGLLAEDAPEPDCEVANYSELPRPQIKGASDCRGGSCVALESRWRGAAVDDHIIENLRNQYKNTRMEAS